MIVPQASGSTYMRGAVRKHSLLGRSRLYTDATRPIIRCDRDLGSLELKKISKKFINIDSTFMIHAKQEIQAPD